MNTFNNNVHVIHQMDKQNKTKTILTKKQTADAVHVGHQK
jgi:hypothetical protein